MPLFFTAKEKALFKNEIEGSIATKIMKLFDKTDKRIDKMEDKIQIMDSQIKSLADQGPKISRAQTKSILKTRKFRTPPPLPPTAHWSPTVADYERAFLGDANPKHNTSQNRLWGTDGFNGGRRKKNTTRKTRKHRR